MLYRRSLPVLFVFFLFMSTYAGNLSEPLSKEKEKELFDQARELEKGDSMQVQQALEIYDFLIENNHSAAMVRKGRLYSKNQHLPRNYKEAFELFEKAANAGNINGIYELGYLYHRGLGTRQDFNTAFNLYKKAADKGHTTACYGAGYFLYRGIGTKQSYSKGIEYLEKGAEKGHQGCYYTLATHYMNGYDGKKDTVKAMKYLKKGYETELTSNPERARENYERISSLKNHPEQEPDAWTDVKRKRLPPAKKLIRNQTLSEELKGVWNGKLYTYDWSRSKIIKEESIEILFDTENERVYLEWRDPETKEIISAYHLTYKDNFWNCSLPLNSGYPEKEKREIYRTKLGIIERNKQPILYADMLMVDYRKREPLESVRVIMDKKEEINSSIEILQIYPLPIKDRITIDFSLSSSQEVYFEIYDLTGKKVYESKGGYYQDGTHSETLTIALGKGGYILHLNGDNFSVSKNILVTP